MVTLSTSHFYYNAVVARLFELNDSRCVVYHIDEVHRMVGFELKKGPLKSVTPAVLIGEYALHLQPINPSIGGSPTTNSYVYLAAASNKPSYREMPLTIGHG